MSIGYEVVDRRVMRDVRELLSLKIYEVSLVTFPANEASGVENVKDTSTAPLTELVQLVTEMRAWMENYVKERQMADLARQVHRVARQWDALSDEIKRRY